MSDPAEAKTPKKPRKAKLPKAEAEALKAAVAAPIVEDLKAATAAVDATFAEVVPQGTIDEQLADLAEGYGVKSTKNYLTVDTLSHIGKLVASDGTTPREVAESLGAGIDALTTAEIPEFKYAYQRIEYLKRLEKQKG